MSYKVKGKVTVVFTASIGAPDSVAAESHVVDYVRKTINQHVGLEVSGRPYEVCIEEVQNVKATD
jgi:hypothetical protein